MENWFLKLGVEASNQWEKKTGRLTTSIEARLMTVIGNGSRSAFFFCLLVTTDYDAAATYYILASFT